MKEPGEEKEGAADERKSITIDISNRTDEVQKCIRTRLDEEMQLPRKEQSSGCPGLHRQILQIFSGLMLPTLLVHHTPPRPPYVGSSTSTQL